MDITSRGKIIGTVKELGTELKEREQRT